MHQKKHNSKKDYNLLYTEANDLLKKFSELPSKKISNSFLDPYFLTFDSADEIKRRLDSALKIVSKQGNVNLKAVLWQNFKYPSLFLGFLKLLSVIIRYLLFYLADNITDILKEFKSNASNYDENKSKTLLNMSLMVCCIVAFCLCNNRFTRYTDRYENHMLIILQIMLYEKLLKAKVYEKRDERVKYNSLGESEEEVLNLTNIITTDVQAAKKILSSFNEIWSSILSINISLIMVGRKLIYSFYFGLSVIILLIIFNLILMSKCVHYLTQMSLFKDKRIALTTDVIQGIKSIKCFSWETIFLKRIDFLRQQEFKNLWLAKCFEAVAGVFFDLTPNLIIFFTFAWCVDHGYNLLDANVFTIIGLVNSLVLPVGTFSLSVSNIAESKVALDRISRYLNREEINSGSAIGIEYNNPFAVEIKGLKFLWPTEKDKNNVFTTEGKEKFHEKEESNKMFEEEEEGEQESKNFQLIIEDLIVEKGELYFTLGGIGNGKTALLKTFLNELDAEPISTNYAKEFKVNGKLAYVSQNNWLQDTSIRNNIIMGAEYDLDWYQTCLEACELVQDLESLPMRDDYIVGSDGSNLSGGQRQRVAICRAIYGKADIYLFDDAFSSLDIHVSEKIFRKLILDLIGSMGKTAFFVTSTHEFIKPDSKLIVVNDSNQVVSHQGEANKLVKALLNFEKHLETKKPYQAAASVNRLMENSAKDLKHYIQLKEEVREEGEISAQAIKCYLHSIGYFLVFLYVFSIIIMQVIKSIIDFWLKSRITPGDNSFNALNSSTINFTFIFGCFNLVVALMTIMNNITYLGVCFRSARILFNKLMGSIIYSKMGFFDKSEVGSIINRISKDTYTIDVEIPTYLSYFSERFITLIASAIIVVIQFPWMFTCFLIALIIMYLNQRTYRVINREIRRLNNINCSKLINHVTETFCGISTIRAFKKEPFFMKEFLNNLNETAKATCCSQLVYYWNDFRMGLCCIFLLSALSFAFTIVVFFKFEIKHSDYAMALTFLLLFLLDLEIVLQYFADLEQSFISVERIRQYFDNQQENINEIPQNVLAFDAQIKEEEANYCLVFDQVFLNYDCRERSKEQISFALKNICFAIKKGEKVAFCGRTGSGKTSILNSLFNLYDIHLGDIRLEGQASQKSLSLADLRSRFAIIPQYGILFRGTLRENLDPEGKYKDEYLNEIIKISGINSKNYSVIKEGSHNYKKKFDLDFSIENSGNNLSSGEKQVINFLRALTLKSDIICLDEATSNVDTETDHELNEAIFKFAEKKTLIVITHRLEHIHRYDRVFVMEKGEIVESGHLKDLSMKKLGFFQKLIEVEKKAFSQNESI